MAAGADRSDSNAIDTFPNGVVSVNVFDGLVTYDETLSPQPGLAENWTVAPDGSSIRLLTRRKNEEGSRDRDP